MTFYVLSVIICYVDLYIIAYRGGLYYIKCMCDCGFTFRGLIKYSNEISIMFLETRNLKLESGF